MSDDNASILSQQSGGYDSADVVAAASLPTKRSHGMMENETSCLCPASLFASGMERLKAAQIEYGLAQKNMEDIRQQIRDSGYAEPDSLLCLSDEEDNHIISYILNYLGVKDVGRCALVCNTLNKQAKYYSDKLSEVHVKNYMGKEPVPKDVVFVGFHPSVAEVCKDAFKDCKKLRNVVFNEGLLTIRKDAFRDCKSLTCITLPSTLIEIADSAFKGCTNLEEVVLNDSLQKIGDVAFSECKSLKSIILPSSLTEMGYFAFSSCCSLTDIVFREGPNMRGQLEVPSHLRARYEMQQFEWDGEFVSNSNLKEVVFYEGGLRRIEKGVFSRCTSLQHITLPSSIYDVGDEAFSGCTSLQHITLPSATGNIGAGAFSGCTSLQHITIPSSIYEIGAWAFYECTKLREVVLNEGLRQIDSQAFKRCRSLESIAIPSTVNEIGYIVFADCTNLKEVQFQDGMKKIDESFDYSWSSLEEIESKIRMEIKHNAFAEFPSLESFKFPWLSTRLEHIIQTGHTDIETKIDEVRGLVGWRDNELYVSAADMALTGRGDNWKSVEQSLNNIVKVLSFYEFKEAGVLFELAMWKAKLDQAEDGANPVNRAACHVEVPEAVKNTILQYLFRGYGE